MPDLKLDIGEGQIANDIAVALAESFSGEKRDALLRDIIRAHMSAKENNYSKETLLNQTVGNKIRTMAREAMEAQIETLRPRIAEIVRQQMGPEFEATVCAQLMAGLSRRKIEGITVSVTMAED